MDAVSRHWIRNQDDETGVLAVVTDPIYVYRDPTCTNKQVGAAHPCWRFWIAHKAA